MRLMVMAFILSLNLISLELLMHYISKIILLLACLKSPNMSKI